jgi:carboxymethylenebutenolidase
MCFDLDARPPLPPIRGAALDSRDLTLTSADGTQFSAFGARATGEAEAGIVIIPDVRGLHPYYEELALRFAEAGVHAVSVDLYARTAGSGKRGEGFEYEPHVKQLRYETVNADIAAALDYLRSEDGGAPKRFYTVGFCMGGRLSFDQAAAQSGLSGVIGMYGWPVGEHRSGIPAPADLADQFTCKVLALYGGADKGISGEVRQAFDDALARAGVEHQTVVYEGAPHSFFDRKSAEYAEASADAWLRMLDFTGVGRVGG